MFWVPTNVEAPMMQPNNYGYTASQSGNMIPQEQFQSWTWTQENLTSQLEHILSRESILYQMDPFLCCLIMELGSLEFPAVSLTSHPSLCPVTVAELIEAASASKILTVDKGRQLIIPGLKPKRSTLILRDVQPDVTAHDILKLLETCEELTFSPQHKPQELEDDESQPIRFQCYSPQVQSLVFGGNQCWFLTLNNEDLTQRVALWLKSQKLKDNPIYVRMKTESPLCVNRVTPTMTPFCHPPLQFHNPIGAKSHPFLKKQLGRKSGYPRQNYHYKSKPRRNFTQELCVFCQKKQKSKLSADQNTVNEKQDPKKSRCLCRLLQSNSRNKTRSSAPKNLNSSNTRIDGTLFKASKPQKHIESVEKKKQSRDWTSEKSRYLEQQRFRRAGKFQTKSSVVNVAQIENSKKKNTHRYKTLHNLKNKPSTYDFPSLDEYTSVAVIQPQQEETEKKMQESEISKTEQTDLLPDSNGGDAPQSIDTISSSYLSGDEL